MRAMTYGQALGDGHPETFADRGEDVLERLNLLEDFSEGLSILGACRARAAGVVLVFAVREIAEHDRRRGGERAGLLELNHHAVDAVEGLVDVFEKQDLPHARLRVRRSRQGGPEREVATDEFCSDRAGRR